MDAPDAQQGLDAPGTLWWLVATRIDLTFQQFVNMMVRLALTLYGTADVAAAMEATVARLERGETVRGSWLRRHCDAPPPSVVDPLLPVKRSGAGGAANPFPAAGDKKKPGGGTAQGKR